MVISEMTLLRVFADFTNGRKDRLEAGDLEEVTAPLCVILRPDT